LVRVCVVVYALLLKVLAIRPLPRGLSTSPFAVRYRPG
jgi:hypothetical protein